MITGIVMAGRSGINGASYNMDQSRAGRIAHSLDIIAQANSDNAAASKEHAAAIRENAQGLAAINQSHQQVLQSIKELTNENKHVARAVQDMIAANQVLEARALLEIESLKTRHETTKQDTKEYRDQSRKLIETITAENKEDRAKFTESLSTLTVGFTESATILSARLDILERDAAHRQGVESERVESIRTLVQKVEVLEDDYQSRKGTNKLWQDNWFKLVTLFIIAIPVIAYLYNSVNPKK